MSNLSLVIIVGLIGGVAIGVQAPLASMIGNRLGYMESAFIVHIVGAIAALVPIVLKNGGNLGNWQTLPSYTLLAGVLGLVIISVLGFVIPRVGVASAIVIIVAGQLVVGAILDHFGLLGTPVKHIDLRRISGLVIVFAGVWITAGR